MRISTRRWAAVGTAALLAAAALTACGGGGDSSGSSTTDSDTKTLTVWHYESDDSAMGQAWNKAIEIFKTEHPGVTVDVEHQTFEQIQKNAKIVLTGKDVPDVMEYNKGNGTAGQLASQGLLTPLTDVAKAKGWDKTLSSSLADHRQVHENGLMGSGDWYGVPNYGEFVGVYLNKDMFAKYGIAVPTTFDEFEAALATFKAERRHAARRGRRRVPARAALVRARAALRRPRARRRLPAVQERRRLARRRDDEGHREAGGVGAEGLHLLRRRGPEGRGHGRLVHQRHLPDHGLGLLVVRSAAEGDPVRLGARRCSPGNTLHPGSSGNIWVVPTNANSKNLAEDFIDITLRPEVQNILGEKGGLPVAGDVSKITDPKTAELTKNFADIVGSDGLAYYPDWPVAGFYDVIVSQLQSLVNQSKTPDQVLDGLKSAYESGKSDLVG